jgi:hypothetical protein
MHRIDGLLDDGVLCRQEWGGGALGPAGPMAELMDHLEVKLKG